jgi:rhodanese-related sulfurtransferase
VSPAALKAMLDAGEQVVLLGISDREDLAAAGRIEGTTQIPLEDLMARHTAVPKEAKVVIVDLAGQQTPIAGRYLVKQGYRRVSRLEGGIKAWIAAGFPVESR